MKDIILKKIEAKRLGKEELGKMEEEIKIYKKTWEIEKIRTIEGMINLAVRIEKAKSDNIGEFVVEIGHLIEKAELIEAIESFLETPKELRELRNVVILWNNQMFRKAKTQAAGASSNLFLLAAHIASEHLAEPSRSGMLKSITKEAIKCDKYEIAEITLSELPAIDNDRNEFLKQLAEKYIEKNMFGEVLGAFGAISKIYPSTLRAKVTKKFIEKAIEMGEFSIARRLLDELIEDGDPDKERYEVIIKRAEEEHKKQIEEEIKTINTRR